MSHQSATSNLPKSGFSHFGICVADLDKAANFYCNVFGFIRTARFQVGPDIAHLVDLPAPVFDIQMVCKDGQLIELICPATPRPVGAAEARPMNQLGVTHLNFRVDDLDAVAALVPANGGRILSETLKEDTIDPASTGGVEGIARLMFCLDPDGTRIELMQVPDAIRYDVPWE